MQINKDFYDEVLAESSKTISSLESILRKKEINFDDYKLIINESNKQHSYEINAHHKAKQDTLRYLEDREAKLFLIRWHSKMIPLIKRRMRIAAKVQRDLTCIADKLTGALKDRVH